MKKIFRLMAILLAALLLATAFVACNETPDGEGGEVEIDSSKTQLYVYCYNSGYGIEWLQSAIKKYEAINADKSFEEGKVGVQVIPYTPRAWPTAAEIKDDKLNEVYFAEQISFRAFQNAGVFADITDAITGENPYDVGTEYPTIESRFDELAQNTFKVDGKYYAIPHFHGSYGLVYNADLFDENDWYFNTDGEIIEFTASNKTRSAGPNGIAGDYDDGLPATYDQFFKLCDKIVEYQMVPVVCSGTSYKMHMEGLMASLIADYEGYENTVDRVNFSGSEILGSIVNGEFKLDSSATAYTEANGAEAFRQPGFYYALTFLERLIKTEGYLNEEAFSDYKMTDAQDDFIYAGKDGETTEIAMLLDGDWWMQEASGTFDDTAEDYGSEEERRLLRMPLPKATEDKIGESVTSYEDSGVYGFINANTAPEKMAVAVDFLQFINSSEQIYDLTKITNTIRPIKHTFTSEQIAALTPYAQSLYEYKMANGAKIATNVSTSALGLRVDSHLSQRQVFKASYGGLDYSPAEAFHKFAETGATAENYFQNLYNRWKGIIDLNK